MFIRRSPDEEAETQENGFKCRCHFTFLITPMVFNIVDFKKLLIEAIFI